MSYCGAVQRDLLSQDWMRGLSTHYGSSILDSYACQLAVTALLFNGSAGRSSLVILADRCFSSSRNSCVRDPQLSLAHGTPP